MKTLTMIGLTLLTVACGAKPPPPKPAAPDQLAVAALAHKVAEIEIGVAKVSFEQADAGGGNHPASQMIDAMAVVPAEIANWRVLPPDQLALLRDVASRIAAAKDGYWRAFGIYQSGDGGLGLASWHAADVIEGAYASTQGEPSQGSNTLIEPDLAAALALREIKESTIIKEGAK